MNKFIKKIEQNGIKSEYSDELNGNIKVTNIIIFIFIFLIIPFIILFRNSLIASVICGLPILVHLCSFFLIRFNNHKAGRFLFSITSIIATYIIAILLYNENLSDGMGVKFLILGSIMLPFIIFSSNERIYSISVMLILLISIFSFNYANDFFDIRIVDNNLDTSEFRIVSILTAFAMISATFFYYQGELTKKNKQLKETNQIIKEQYEELTTSEEKLRESNKTKDKFFSIIAHDLRSPFNSILGFSNLLLNGYKDLDDKKRKEIYQHLNSSASQAFELLENLLEWANSQREKMPFKKESCSLFELLSEELIRLKDVAAYKEIELIAKINEDIKIEADTNMLKSIFRNLLSNAIKFTHKGGKIIIKAYQTKNFIHVSIKDNGIGIDELQRKKLFSSTENNSTPGTEQEKGTGLGLILCKEFVEKHGGKLWFESEVGKGSEFVFTIPAS